MIARSDDLRCCDQFVRRFAYNSREGAATGRFTRGCASGLALIASSMILHERVHLSA